MVGQLVELRRYFFEQQRMVFQVGGRSNVIVLPFEDDAEQRWLLRSEGAEIKLDGYVRVHRCFVTPFGAIDPSIREETMLTSDGFSSFESVFHRYWEQEYPGRELSDDTNLFVLMTRERCDT